MKKISDFKIMQQMSDGNMDIKMAPPDNFKRASIGKNGFGEVTMAVDNETIMNLNKYFVALYVVNQEQFEALKKKVIKNG